MKKIKVAINGYGVIGKRVADAVTLQDDMELTGICDVVTDWRIKMAEIRNYPVFGFDETFNNKMQEAGINVTGTLNDLLKYFFFLMIRRPPRSTLFPYQTVTSIF